MSLTLIANLYSVSDDKINIGSGRVVRLSPPPHNTRHVSKWSEITLF